MRVKQTQIACWAAVAAGFIAVLPFVGRAPGQALAAQVVSRPAPDATDPFDEVRALIHQLMEERALPSVAVAAAKDGEILWEEGFGWADRERQISATPHTPYSLASISKPLTATGLMRLVEEGEVRLDEPANDYLGRGRLTGLAGDAEGATVRRVLSHTAGLPLHYQFFYDGSGYGPPSMDETISRYGILVNPAGEVYQYSNLGYGILDHIISRVSGEPYADFMRKNVFLPLGMTRTSIDIGPGLEPFAAARYDDQQRPIPFYTFDHNGASAAWSSAHDLALFGMFQLGEHVTEQPILHDTTLSAMQRIATPDSETQGYGLGWLITADDHGYRRVGHSGGMPGVATVLNLYPAERLVVVVLTNKSDGAVGRIAQEIAAAVLPEYRAALEAEQARTASERSVEPFRPGPELVGEWTGMIRTHEGTVPFVLVFQPDGDVHARIDDQLEALVNEPRFADGTFAGRVAGTIPTSDADRHAHSVFLNLRLVDGRLAGQATAQTLDSPVYFALTSYVELKRPLAAS